LLTAEEECGEALTPELEEVLEDARNIVFQGLTEGWSQEDRARLVCFIEKK
jgi:hypothetical protein